MQPKLSGWAQKIVSDKKLRKAKATAGTRLLALTPATQVSAAGELGSGGQGVALEVLAARVPVDPGELQHLVHQLTAADWLAEATLTGTRLSGRLTERVLPAGLHLRHDLVVQLAQPLQVDRQRHGRRSGAFTAGQSDIRTARPTPGPGPAVRGGAGWRSPTCSTAHFSIRSVHLRAYGEDHCRFSNARCAPEPARTPPTESRIRAHAHHTAHDCAKTTATAGDRGAPPPSSRPVREPETAVIPEVPVALKENSLLSSGSVQAQQAVDQFVGVGGSERARAEQDADVHRGQDEIEHLEDVRRVFASIPGPVEHGL